MEACFGGRELLKFDFFLFEDAFYARFRRVLCMIILPCIFSHFSAHPHRYLITGNIGKISTTEIRRGLPNLDSSLMLLGAILFIF